MTILEDFAKICKSTEKDLKFWKEENNLNDKIIIAGPSRIIGLIDLTKCDDIGEWITYGKLSEPTKKMVGNFVFEGNMFGVSFLRDIFSMLSESVEITLYKESILFKITESVSIGIGHKIAVDDWYYNDEGVMFVEFDWTETKDEWKTTTTDKEFIKWENGVAKRKHSGKGLVWYEEVYRFEYFFEEEEDWGDMMLL